MLKILRRLARNPLYVISLLLLLVVVLITLFPGLFAPYDPYKMDVEAFMSWLAMHGMLEPKS